MSLISDGLTKAQFMPLWKEAMWHAVDPMERARLVLELGRLHARGDGVAGPLLIATADALLSNRLAAGAYALVAFSGAYDEAATIFDLGLTLKARFPVRSAEIRVGPVLAYQRISVDVSSVDDSSGLNIGAVFEVLFPLTSTLNGIGELGFISQPTGGNDDTDVTFAPILYVAAGVGFGG